MSTVPEFDVMSDYLSREMRAEFDAARRAGLRRKSRLRIVAGNDDYPVLRMLAEGFTLDADMVGELRGLVDLYDGSRHLAQCLIMAADIEGGELVCTMKWQTRAGGQMPVDYVRDPDAPAGYLPEF